MVPFVLLYLCQCMLGRDCLWEQCCSTWSSPQCPPVRTLVLETSNQGCGSLDSCLKGVWNGERGRWEGATIQTNKNAERNAKENFKFNFVGCIPKYLENFSALSVALMRMTLRSSRMLSRSFTMTSKTSDCRFLSWISSSTKWLILDNNLKQ